MYFCVTISLIVNSFYNILSDKTVPLFHLLFQIQPENQSASLPQSRGKAALSVTLAGH